MNTLNSQKGFVLPLVIVIAVILIGGGIYLAGKNKTPSVNVESNATTTLQSPVGSTMINGTKDESTIPTLTVAGKVFPNSNVVYGGSTVPFLAFTLQANNGDVVIDSFTIQKTGTLNNVFVRDVSLIEDKGSNNSEIGIGGKFNSYNQTVIKANVVIKSGETKTFYLNASFDKALSGAKYLDDVRLSIDAIHFPGQSKVKIVGDLKVASPLMKVELLENTAPVPVINSINPGFGPVGTYIELKGTNFSGFEGDKYAWIENYSGQKGVIYSEPGSTNESIRFKLAEKYCTKDNSYSGGDCVSYLYMSPGVYKIFVSPWGKTSAKVEFIITK